MDNMDKYKIKGDKGTKGKKCKDKKGIYTSKHIRIQNELQLKTKQK